MEVVWLIPLELIWHNDQSEDVDEVSYWKEKTADIVDICARSMVR